MAGKKERNKQRKKEEEKVSERRSGAFRHKNTPAFIHQMKVSKQHGISF
jgi:hypothetical protein